MNIESRIPANRIGEGDLYVDGSLVGRCRGKADNAAAANAGNPHRSPARPFGDHPAGRYRVTEVQWRQAPDRTYGPCRIVVQPEDISSDDECALRERAEAGDDGIMLHGGDPQPDGVSLRATHGCLRMANSVAAYVGKMAEQALARGESVKYVCALV